MTSQFLPVYVGNALVEAAELQPVLERGRPTLQDALEYSQYLRIAGIGQFLLTGKDGGLRWRLHQSARAFASCLRRIDVSHQATGRALPLLDAHACGDSDGALAIARAARHTWNRDEEYPEDFYFFEYVLQRYSLKASTAERVSLLSQWEVCLEGSADQRLDVCRALEEGDAGAFAAGLAAFLDARAAVLTERAQGGALAPEVAATERYLSVEGIALIRLGSLQGMAAPQDLPGAPLAALGTEPLDFADDSWLDLA